MFDTSWATSGNECHRIGIMGGCGIHCPILLRGDCEESGELMSEYQKEEVESVNDSYDRAMKGI